VEYYDIIIVGSGPAGLGAAFQLIEQKPDLKIAIIEKSKISSGGFRNDGKQNYTYPIGFEEKYWDKAQAEYYLDAAKLILDPDILTRANMDKYHKRIEKIEKNIRLVEVDQAHIGTDKASAYIRALTDRLKKLGVVFLYSTELDSIDEKAKEIMCINSSDKQILHIYRYHKLVIAPGRKGIGFLQEVMDQLKIEYADYIIDIGVRAEAKRENYRIVDDYYDPKIYLPGKVRTFCTNSGYAIVKRDPTCRFSVNGEALSAEKGSNNLINFALLKTMKLTEPISSGREFAEIIGKMILGISKGKLIMQRVGDFRCKKRSTAETFNDHDLGYDFLPTYQANPGDIALGPLKIILPIWEAFKYLDKIVPGILHPSTVLYFPEIKMYANKPEFLDNYFQAYPDIYLIGDGAGTSRGITGAWASGARAADGILKSL